MKERHLPVRRAAFLLALLLTSCAGCISISGTSSRQLKAEYLAASAVVNVKRLYGTETLTFPLQRRRLDDPELAALQKELTQIAHHLATAHKEFSAYILEAFGSATVGGGLDPIAYVTQHDVPSAFSPKVGVIEVDVLVLDSLFRGALLDANETTSKSTPDFRPVTEERQRKELNAVNTLLKNVRAVELIPGRTGVGDMISGIRDMIKSDVHDVFKEKDDEDPSTWNVNTLLEKAVELQEFELLYRGALRFLLAHEIGHTVLNHHALLEQLKTADYCPARRELEYEADAYAVVLLGYRLRQELKARGAQGVGGDYSLDHRAWWRRPTEQEELAGLAFFERWYAGLTGYQNFFEYTYKLAGFGGSEKVPSCEYPSPAERYSAALALHTKLWTAAWSNPRHIVQEHLREVASK